MVKYSLTINLVPHEKKDGTHLIRFRVSFLGERLVYYAPYSVPLSHWNDKRCIAKAGYVMGHVTSALINKSISDIISGVNEYFSACDVNDERPSVKALKKSLDGECRSKLEYDNRVSVILREFMEQQGTANAWSHNTLKKFTKLERQLMEYNPKITMDDFDEAGLIGIINYWHSLEHRNTTIAKEYNELKWFLRWATKHGYLKDQTYLTFRPRFRGVSSATKSKLFLTWEELMAVEELSGLPPYLDRARDCFLFQCFTGLRYSDIAQLRRSNIHDDAIHLMTIKDSDHIVVELNDHSRAIIEKYRNYPTKDDLVLPIISAVKMNAYIKKVCLAAGMVSDVQQQYMRGSKMVMETKKKYELMSTHIGRHTFIVHALRLGIQPEVVMRWTGHSDYKAMRPYVDIVDAIKRESMEKFNK